jgi:hypothetical protein
VSLRGYTLTIARRHGRRALPLLLAAPLLPPRRLPERPIFVIGCPRSGTTVTFLLLRMAPGATSIRREGHVLWESFHHPRANGWDSNALDASDVGSIERRYIAWTIRILAGHGRFVDKTPRNVLRLPYLDALFPDATYVFVVRDARSIVSSLYEHWPRGGRLPYRLPGQFAVQGLPRGYWRFVLVPGWRDLDGRPLEEVCARQYTESTEAILRFRDSLPPEREVTLRYEDLLQDPVTVTRDMFSALQLDLPPHVAERVRNLVHPPPRQPKWETTHRAEVERVLPQISSLLTRTGYAN